MTCYADTHPIGTLTTTTANGQVDDLEFFALWGRDQLLIIHAKFRDREIREIEYGVAKDHGFDAKGEWHDHIFEIWKTSLRFRDGRLTGRSIAEKDDLKTPPEKLFQKVSDFAAYSIENEETCTYHNGGLIKPSTAAQRPGSNP